MDILQGIIIGVVQGLTEFLPISSSAHLIFIHNILGVGSSLAFDTFLHMGSLIAVLFFFRKDVYEMIRAWVLSVGDIAQGRFVEGFKKDPYKRLAWYVILGTIPVGIVGILFESQVEALFAGALYVPAFFLFVTGTILYLSQRMNSGKVDFNNMSAKESLLSRSGTTIAAGLTIGLNKEFAAKFSFILSIPAILGATVVQLGDIGSALDANLWPVAFGFIAAAVSGYIAIKWVLDLIQNKSLDIFAYYCWAIGIIIFMGSITNLF